MDMNAVIARINELAAKNKLRRIKMESVTGSLKGQMDNTYLVRPDGSKEKVRRK